MEMFDHLDPMLKVLWCIALPASLIFVIQAVMSFMGLDSGEATAADFDGDLHGGDAPFQVFSLRNFINFALGFGWTGVCIYDELENKNIVLLLALLVGLAFVAIFFFMMRMFMRLAEDNTFKIESIVGRSGETYLSIPAGKSGTGKIQISVNGSFREIPAMTAGEKIETGAMIRVIAIHSGIAEVEKI